VEADGPLDSGRLLFIVTKNLGPSFAVNVRMQASAEGLGIEYEAPEFPLLHPHSDLRMPVGRIRPGPYMVPVKLSWLDWTGEHDEAHLVAGTA
jgi:hypothetical protein